MRVPFCSCAAPLARSHTLPLPLRAALPLARIPPGPSPSPYAHPPWSFPFPLRASPPVPPAPPACAQRGKMCGRGGVRKPRGGGRRSQAGGDWGWRAVPPAPPGMQERTAGGAGQGGARKLGGTMGAATRVRRPTQTGRVSKWGCRGNGGAKRTFCTPCLCDKVG